MNNFKVSTPGEWKSNLYLSIDKPKKKFNYRAAAAIAAVVALIVSSTTGFAYSQAPEYFGSRFFGVSKEGLQEIYSPKNVIFESKSDEFTLTCEGIAGDKKSLFAVFELKSNGEYSFNPDVYYGIDEWDVELKPIELNGWSIGSSSYHVDEKTIKIDVSFRSITNSIIGRTLHLKMKNVVCIDGDESIDCEFEGKIKIDYPDTAVRLSKTKETAQAEEISFIGKKAWISNLGFEFELDIIENAEKYEAEFEYMIPFDKMILTYDDGMTEEYFNRMPKQTDKDIVIASSSRDKNTVRLKGRFPQLINSSKVVSVAFDDYVMFIK